MSIAGSHARALVLRAGGLTVMRQIGRRAVRILLYHRFAAGFRENLERQCEHMRRYYSPVSLSEIDRWLYDGEPMPPNPIAITIDDGYRDIYEMAYPMFRAYGIPVTVFITTGFIDRECWLWVDKLAWMFRQAAPGTIEIPFPDGAARFSLQSEASRSSAMQATKAVLKGLSQGERMRFIQEILPAIMKVTVPAQPTGPYEPLTWDEIREMTQGGFSFGAHTITHPILSSLESPAAMESEIAGSKKRLEEELSAPVPHFSYPNGMPKDFDANVVDVVKRAGFRSAVVASGSINVRPVDPFLVKRNAVEPSTPMSAFSSDITGFRTVLRAWCGRP